MANSVSESYEHWLGDAFASGGSNGYDHKKMGITARGAWVSAARRRLRLPRGAEGGGEAQERQAEAVGWPVRWAVAVCAV